MAIRLFYCTRCIIQPVNGNQSGSFADWMKTIRESAGLNQLDLSERMEFDKSVVSRVESGQKEPTADFVVAFAAAVEADVREALLVAGYPVNESSFKELSDEKAALEIVRLLAEFPTDEDREDAIANIRAILKVSAERAKHRKPGKANSGGTHRGKPDRDT